jgi:hypothetical protein
VDDHDANWKAQKHKTETPATDKVVVPEQPIPRAMESPSQGSESTGDVEA